MDDSEILAILAELGSYRYINDENEEILNHNLKNINKNERKKKKRSSITLHEEQEEEEDEENINKVYEAGVDCLDAARALYRMLNEDDEIERYVFHYLGRIDIARNKLVPILLTYPSETNLVVAILKIYVKLTLQLPLHIESYDIPKQTLYTLNLKEAFINKELIKTLLDILKEPMTNLGLSSGTTQDYIVIELILTLIKNMLQIQDPISSQTLIESEYRCHMHNNLVELLEEENILELFLVLAQNIQSSKVYKQMSIYSLLLLEIFTLLLKNDNPNEIWSSNKEVNGDGDESNNSSISSINSNKATAEKTLIGLLRKEKKLSSKLISNTSRGRFIGAYSTSENASSGKKIINKTLPDQATVNPIRPTNLNSFSVSLLSSRTKVIGERKKTPSSPKVRFILKSWSEQFLDGCYNTLMSIIIDEFAKDDAQILDSDRINFLLLTRFFTGFSLSLLRYHNDRIEKLKQRKQQDKELDKHSKVDKEFEPQDDDDDEDDEEIDGFTHDNIIGSLSSTLSPSNFQFIFACCSNYQQMKKNLSLEIGVSTLREMIALLNYMSCSPIEQYNKISFQMQSSIYYDRDAFLKLVVQLLRNYQPSIYSKSMILDLIDLSFTTVIMVENFCKRNNTIVVKSKKQARRAKSLVNDDSNTNGNAGNQIDDLSDDDGLPDEEEREDQEDFEQIRDTMDFDSFMSEFANVEIIRNLSLVLGGYHGNTSLVNHQIIQMFKRIAKDMDMEPMFYQLSLFYLFKNLLNDPLISNSRNGDSRDLIQLINQILSNYFKVAESNPSFLIDILIPKSKSDCFYLRAELEEEEEEKQRERDREEKDETIGGDGDDDQDEFDENGIPILKISKNTGRLKKNKSGKDSDEGEVFLDSGDEDDDKKGYILQNIVSKMEDSLKKQDLIEKIKTIYNKKIGPKFVDWLQNHLLNAIIIRNQEKEESMYSTYKFTYTEDDENYSGVNKEIKSIFSTLKFRHPLSKNGWYEISQLKNYTPSYLTVINQTIKEALIQYTAEKEQREKEKEERKKSVVRTGRSSSTSSKGKKKKKNGIVPRFDKFGNPNPDFVPDSDDEHLNESGNGEKSESEKSESEQEEKLVVKKSKSKTNSTIVDQEFEPLSSDDEKEKEERDKEDEKKKSKKQLKEQRKKDKKEKKRLKKQKQQQENYNDDDEEEQEEEEITIKEIPIIEKKSKKKQSQEESEVEPMLQDNDDEEDEDETTIKEINNNDEDEDEEEISIKETTIKSKSSSRKSLKKMKVQDSDSDEETQILESTKSKTFIDTDDEKEEESDNSINNEDEDEDEDFSISHKKTNLDKKRKNISISDDDEDQDEEVSKKYKTK